MTEADTHTDDVPVRPVQTARIRYKPSTDQYRLTLTQAIRAAGLDKNATFRYVPEEVDQLGVVPALGSDSADTTLRDGRTYSVSSEGATGEALRLQIPAAALEALGIDTDTEEVDDLPLLDVYAGDQLLAFDISNAKTISSDLLPGFDGTTDDEDIILEPIQTTAPRVRTEGVVSAAITPALKRAGDNIGAVEFHPPLAADLDGLVPAVGHKYGDARGGGDVRSVYRKGPNELESPIPAEVLDALDLSIDDYEDVPVDERPLLVVFAGNGDGVIAFARPGQRELTVNREQTPTDDGDPNLTDVDGIGAALAERLSDHGIESVEELAEVTREDLLKIHRLGPDRADSIMADIGNR